MQLRTNIGMLAIGVAIALGGAPHAAAAQDRPSYATRDEDSIKGRIVSLSGSYDVLVRDERGFVDRVRLHQGTIINPTGLALSPGMTVTILGVNEGSVLAANEIDTAYTISPPPVYVVPSYPVAYFGAPYAYGAPYYNYGYPARFGYGYGYGYPGVAIGLNFGGYRGYGYRGYPGYRGYGAYRGAYGARSGVRR